MKNGRISWIVTIDLMNPQPYSVAELVWSGTDWVPRVTEYFPTLKQALHIIKLREPHAMAELAKSSNQVSSKARKEAKLAKASTGNPYDDIVNRRLK